VPRRQGSEDVRERPAAVARVGARRERQQEEDSQAPRRRRHSLNADPLVSVVIVSYNTRSYVEQSLDRLSGSPHELIVVDNASSDGTAELVRTRFPNVALLELADNRGFGAAANAGMGAAAGEFFLILNADAWPIGDGIERLAAFADRRPPAGVVGPALTAPDGTPQRSTFGFPTRWWTGAPAVTSAGTPPLLDRMLSRLPMLGRRRVFVVGAAMLLRRKAVDAVGGFDESFFLFNEDVDLCWRMWNRGWTVELCRDARFVHVGGASVRDWTPFYREQVRGHLRVLARHAGTRAAEGSRRVLTVALRFRGRAAGGAQRTAYRETSEWLASGTVDDLLGGKSDARVPE
jgi:N-acetylglucosaminyl-diphospho-decaprenol L-rhamnosyltransferase